LTKKELKQLITTVNKVVSIKTDTRSHLNCQEPTLLRMRRVFALKDSPDALIRELQKFIHFGEEKDDFEEETQKRYLILTTVAK
jgi:hypothetical protein